MTVLAVDLAAKYSAACLMGADYRVIEQFDSWGSTEDAFIAHLTSLWGRYAAESVPEVMVVEDLPHGLRYSTLIKTVCRLQGRIAHAMTSTDLGDLHDVLFLAPATWRAHYPEAKRGTGPDIVLPIAEGFGYTAPDFTVRAKGNGGKGRARKVATDYCSAYLIARWAMDMKSEHGTYDVPGTSRYDTDVIRKKDFDDQDS